MALAKLIYVSRAASPFTEDQLAALAQKSAKFNAGADITGALVYCHGQFMQLLEGESNAIRSLYGSIGMDRRHRDLRLITLEMISVRSFSGWAMSHLHERRISGTELARMKILLGGVGSASSKISSNGASVVFDAMRTAIGCDSSRASRERYPSETAVASSASVILS